MRKSGEQKRVRMKWERGVKDMSQWREVENNNES